MLTPGYLAGIPEALVALYGGAEADILTNMAERIAQYDYYIPAVQHQHQRLRAMGVLESEIEARLSALAGRSMEALRRLMTEAVERSLTADAAVYAATGMGEADVLAAAGVDAVLRAGLAQTGGLFTNLTCTTARTAAKQFEDALDRAWLQITSGGFDYSAAVRNAVKDLSRQGVKSIRYSTGHEDTLETAVRRAVITGCSQTAARAQLALMDEMGADLVEVTAHAGARPSHAQWQGKIYSRSGQSGKYPDFVSSTGYGTGEGLCGWNCSHSFAPWFEGAPRAYPPELLEEYAAKAAAYNGRSMTEYEARQNQRYIERQLRRWKREYKAMEAAGQSTEEEAAKISEWRTREADFCRQAGLRRQGDRPQIADFGRREAARAHWAVAKYEKIRYHKDGTIITTDDWTGKEHVRIPSKYKPNAVVDTLSQNGKQRDRTIYDETGVIKTQIHGGDHGNSKRHPYGRRGEHVHDYTWFPGQKKPDRRDRSATELEYIQHRDILEDSGHDDR